MKQGAFQSHELSHFNIFKRPVVFYGDSKNFSHSTYLANIFYSCYVATDYKVYYYYLINNSILSESFQI